MAKLNREGKLREKRIEKQARKTARRLSAAHEAGEAAFPSEDLDAASGSLDSTEQRGAAPESVAVASDAAGRDA